jgi:uroporphyrinogen decarboxylase
MFSTTADLTIDSLQLMIDGEVKPDGIFPNDDIAYRNGLLFSPTLHGKLIFPHVKRICQFARSNGMDVIQHSCGDIREAIPMLIEAGVQCLQPLECKAGMDVRQLKRQYGKDIAFMGNIDVRKMEHFDEAEMEEEISSKVTVAKEGGGYVFQSDHSVPATVSLSNYKRTLEIALKHAWY